MGVVPRVTVIMERAGGAGEVIAEILKIPSRVGEPIDVYTATGQRVSGTVSRIDLAPSPEWDAIVVAQEDSPAGTPSS